MVKSDLTFPAMHPCQQQTVNFHWEIINKFLMNFTSCFISLVRVYLRLNNRRVSSDGDGYQGADADSLTLGSFFLSLTENLQHVLSLKLYFYGHNVTFQVTIECYTNQFIDRHFD